MGLFKRASEADGAVEDRIRAAISEVGPLLKLETIEIVLVKFERESGLATLRFEGDCPHCEMSASMLRDGIEAHLKTQVPEVHEVREA
ncbi:MAG TPA: NifU family protein [Gemmatimonadaceae bacterium]|jgi:Fe-S cluster biogenesis protein NfuA|nr:NifU family protein [Gemmatimonadaceae bacterium]